MASKPSPHMNPGEGEASYARNSTFQGAVQDRMKTVIEEAVTDLLDVTSTPHRKENMVIADLGCSSGPNALRLVSAAVDAIYSHCVQHAELILPEICVFLNDLPNNDFNTVAKSLATLKNGTSKDCSNPVLISGMIPGSFYERLFARGSLHFVSSANSLNWLSKAPEDLTKSRIPMYDSNEILRLARSQIVADAYAQQFRKDFMMFLNLRAQELVPGGRMVISLLARCSQKPDHEFTQPWNSVVMALSDMALRGVISKEKLDSFHIPLYSPLDKEVDEIIEAEGSFKIHKMLEPGTYRDVDKSLVNPKMMALGSRAAFEPIIVQHFGSSKEIMDEFVRTIEQHFSSWGMEYMLSAEYPLVTVYLSLTRSAI